MSAIGAVRTPKWMVWTGRVLSALPVLMLLFSASMKLRRTPEVLQFFTGKFGYPGDILTILGIVEISCAILYAIPATSVLGAILCTGYLGGATATHVRVGDPFIAPVVLGVIVWAGLFLRDDRVRSLLPLRRG